MPSYLSHSPTRRSLGVFIAGVLGLVAAPAFAVDTGSATGPTGSASAYDLSVHINLLGLSQLNVDAQTMAQLTDVTESDDDAQQVNGIDVTAPLSLIHLQTGLLTSEAEYAAGSLSAIAARSQVAGLDLSAIALLGNPVLSANADLVTSTSVLVGSCPPPPADDGTQSLLGDFIFFDGFDGGNNLRPVGVDDGSGQGGLPGNGAGLGTLTISLLGISVPIPLNPAPNTTIDLPGLGIVGATLILNERTTSGDGITSLSTAGNAVHLSLNVAGLVTAEVIVAHSDASLTCP